MSLPEEMNATGSALSLTWNPSGDTHFEIFYIFEASL